MSIYKKANFFDKIPHNYILVIVPIDLDNTNIKILTRYLNPVNINQILTIVLAFLIFDIILALSLILRSN